SWWYPDSGATHHLTNDFSNLSLAGDFHGSETIQMANGAGMKIAHLGKSYIESAHKPNHLFYLNNLFHVPQITKNLLSVSQFAKDNKVFFEFYPLSCFVKDQATKEVLLEGNLKNGLYTFSSSEARV
ncbi:Unknown protein, partial [Striga hermonthica]